jgi:hypothetical protein
MTAGPADAATFDTGASAGRGDTSPVAASALRGGAAARVSLNTVPRGPVAGADADGPAARALWWGSFLLRARGVLSLLPQVPLVGWLLRKSTHLTSRGFDGVIPNVNPAAC